MDKAKIFSFRSVAESLDMAWLPIIFVIIALLLILLNPISAYRHGIIRRLNTRTFLENHANP